ncbi:MAG: hypothetical protein B7Y80_09300 [Hyphomicrobium sp. 32-62-53]|nr:MAG: hypothetical protein B7Z29_09320 [Hyphomicrobium sp. 12-62-95]OYY00088.1 MAG: hypothetical protein B7Y80_09300 [Hyphomicrobium sp. 32-62-53]
MALISETAICLRFFGDDLQPELLTAALGHPPTSSATKGEAITSEKSGRISVANSGKWLLSVDRRQPGDLNGQIQELFGALTEDLSVWRILADKYQPDLFVGLFLTGTNEGIEMSARSLEILATRGVRLSLDIYGQWADTP